MQFILYAYWCSGQDKAYVSIPVRVGHVFNDQDMQEKKKMTQVRIGSENCFSLPGIVHSRSASDDTQS